jgi:acetyl-CoA carboxylase carboxyl transferase subunit beta
VKIRAVGALITGPDGRVLLVLRGHEPGKGQWSVPGGRINPGETPENALVREVHEETGLHVVVQELLGHLTIPISAENVYAVTDYRCQVVGGELVAGDDAADVRWVALTELTDLPTTTDLVEFLERWVSAPS